MKAAPRKRGCIILVASIGLPLRCGRSSGRRRRRDRSLRRGRAALGSRRIGRHLRIVARRKPEQPADDQRNDRKRNERRIAGAVADGWIVEVRVATPQIAVGISVIEHRNLHCCVLGTRGSLGGSGFYAELMSLIS